MKKLLLLSVAIITLSQLHAQDGVVISSTTGATPDAYAILDVQSTSKGMLVPRMTQAQRDLINPSTSGIGMLVFVTDGSPSPFFSYWDGSIWVVIPNLPSGNSALSLPVKIIASNTDYTATDKDYSIGYKHTTGTPTLTLPDASTSKGRIYVVRSSHATGHSELIIKSNGGNVEYQPASTGFHIGASNEFQAVTFQSDGTDWWIITATKL